MILKDDFYTILKLTKEDSIIQATLKLNPEHHIFAGHFPGQPVVPGVCMVQMIKELLELVTEKRVMLQQSDHIKFLSMVNPVNDTLIDAVVQYHENADFSVTASLQCAERICLKFKGLFTARGS